MKILVTGGAGYIGSFMTKRLLDEGEEVIVVDSLERGHKEAVDPRATLVIGDLLDKKFVTSLFSGQELTGVIHFGGYISMRESVYNPGLYFENNVQTSVNLLDTMVKHHVDNFIFSSTAGVYGNPVSIPIPEDHQKMPTNPYGESKLMVERVLPWYEKVSNLRFIVLRYFNAAGAALDGSMGENHAEETHIIPNVIRAAIEGREFTLFGKDYDTPDGTAVRDYIHVLDLVQAHLLGLQRLRIQKSSGVYNVGTGRGYSNKEIVKEIEQVSGKEIIVKMDERRPGDAAMLVADVSKIQRELNFIPHHSDIKTIVTSAWKWHTQSK